MDNLEFGKLAYRSVEEIVCLSNAPFDNKIPSSGSVRIGIAKGRISDKRYTLIHNFGDSSSSSGKYVQIFDQSFYVAYTIWENGSSDRELPSDLLGSLRSFRHSD